MTAVRFDIIVKQHRKESYFDSDKDAKVEYDIDNEIHGKFYNWEQVESFTNNVLLSFENATVEIKIIREEK